MFILLKYYGNSVKDTFRDFFSIRNYPTEKTIRSIVHKFEETESVMYERLCVLVQLKNITLVFKKWRWPSAYAWI